MLSPRQWAERHFSGVDLKDQRLNKRAIQVAQTVARHPWASMIRRTSSADRTVGTRLTLRLRCKRNLPR